MYDIHHDFDQTTARVKAFREDVDFRTERSVTELLIRVEGYALPMIPMATGHLAGSSERDVSRTGQGWEGELSYPATSSSGQNYAGFVHEAPGTLMGMDVPRWPKRLGFVWGPSGEPQFLQKAIDRVYRQGVSEWIGSFYA